MPLSPPPQQPYYQGQPSFYPNGTGQTVFPQNGYAQPGFGQVPMYGNGIPGYGAPGYGAPVHVVQLYYMPTVVLNDGRVLANFGTGRGYEQVLRQCPALSGTLPPNFAVAPCWIVDAYGRYSVLQQR